MTKPPSTGCLPVEFTAQQLAAWETERRQDLRRRLKHRAIVTLLAVALLTTLTLITWGALTQWTH